MGGLSGKDHEDHFWEKNEFEGVGHEIALGIDASNEQGLKDVSAETQKQIEQHRESNEPNLLENQVEEEGKGTLLVFSGEGKQDDQEDEFEYFVDPRGVEQARNHSIVLSLNNQLEVEANIRNRQ